MDRVLWILAIIGFAVAAFGQWRGDMRMVALGWLALALAAFTFVV